MLCDIQTRKEFQVKPTTVNIYLTYTALGCLFLSWYYSSNFSSNPQLDYSTSQQVVPRMQRPELAAHELAGIWKQFSRVCVICAVRPPGWIGTAS